MKHNFARRMAVGAVAAGAVAGLVVMVPGAALAPRPPATDHEPGRPPPPPRLSSPRCTPRLFSQAQQLVEADLAARVAQLNALSAAANNTANHLTTGDRQTLQNDITSVELPGIQALQTQVQQDTTCAAAARRGALDGLQLPRVRRHDAADAPDDRDRRRDLHRRRVRQPRAADRHRHPERPGGRQGRDRRAGRLQRPRRARCPRRRARPTGSRPRSWRRRRRATPATGRSSWRHAPTPPTRTPTCTRPTPTPSTSGPTCSRGRRPARHAARRPGRAGRSTPSRPLRARPRHRGAGEGSG